MIIFDAFAVVALVANERAAQQVAEMIRSNDTIAIGAINLAESLDVLLRSYQAPPEEIQASLGSLVDKCMVVKSVDAETAWKAALIRANNYHRKKRPLSMADCFLLASAAEGDSIATADKHIAAVAKAEGIEVLDL